MRPLLLSSAIQGLIFGQSEVLKGLQEVSVVVRYEQSATAKTGLFDSEDIKRDAQIRLRRAGVSVVEESDHALVISLKSLASCSDIQFSMQWEVQLEEPVSISRRPGKVDYAATWMIRNFGYAGKDVLSSARQWVGDAVDVFVNDWLKANPPARSVIVPPWPLGSQPVTKKY